MAGRRTQVYIKSADLPRSCRHIMCHDVGGWAEGSLARVELLDICPPPCRCCMLHHILQAATWATVRRDVVAFCSRCGTWRMQRRRGIVGSYYQALKQWYRSKPVNTQQRLGKKHRVGRRMRMVLQKRKIHRCQAAHYGRLCRMHSDLPMIIHTAVERKRLFFLRG